VGPPPRPASATEANARWIAYRCGECSRHWLRLGATMPIPTGAPITAPPHDWIISATPWDQQVVILCDGSYRGPGADRASGHGGAAAIAYAAGVEVGRTCVTLPTCGSAVEAEAHGISLALALAQRHRRWGPVLIAGDCAATINHCAGRGRVRDPQALTILQAALERDGSAAIAAHWACINRADNEAADTLAKAARQAAGPRKGHATCTP